MTDFIHGLELSHQYYWQIVRPLLDQNFPGLPHAAGLIGPGSEVLGFDTEMSMDHHWFPRVLIFLKEEDLGLSQDIYEKLSWELPSSFMGFPLNLVEIPDEPGIYLMKLKKDRPINHGIHPTTVRAFTKHYLGIDNEQGLEVADWLSMPSQKLRTMTEGAVHHDGIGELTNLRKQLACYPRDIWLYLLASGWQRISEQEHLMPRAGYAGDELGSALICSRLVRDIMAICFLMEQKYAPYPKWFGSAFQQLDCADDLMPLLRQSLVAEKWQLRESTLAQAYEFLANMHNGLGITEPLSEHVSNFHGRPFKVIHGERFAQANLKQIEDAHVKRLARRSLIGNVDQFSDNTKLLSDATWQPEVRHFYEG